MEDPNETRKIAADWREYLADFREMYRVYRWAWNEFVQRDGKVWVRRNAALLVLLMAIVMAEPLAVKAVADALVSGDWPDVRGWLLVFLGVSLTARLVNWRYGRTREYIDGAVLQRVDDRTTELFFEKSLGQHLRDDGVLNAPNVEKGRARVFTIENTLLYAGLPVVVELAVSFACLFAISWQCGLIMLAVFVVYLGHMLYINTRVMQVYTPIDAAHRRLYRHRVLRWELIERVVTSGKGPAERDYMRATMSDIMDKKEIPFWVWVTRTTMLRGLANVAGIAACLWWGAVHVHDGLWTVGMFFPLYMWSRRLADNMWRVTDIERQLNWNMPAVRAMMVALTQPAEVVERADAAPLPQDATPTVEFRGVSHAYSASAKLTQVEPNGAPKPELHVLRACSFVVKPGEKVAVIGPSGAGKTTVMRLLQRYMDPEHGEILINGLDLRALRLDDWRGVVGYIPQQPQLFDDTLRYNLLYGLTDADRAAVSDDELWRVVRLLEIDFGERLTHGLDTMVGKRGLRLSGGQAQRVMIGAAVLKRPRFLIIDEATSSLDSTTERAVQAGLAKVIPATTSVLVIAHRLSTVQHFCDKFVVMRTAETTPDGTSQIETVSATFEGACMASPTLRRLAADQGIVAPHRPAAGSDPNPGSMAGFDGK